MEDSPHVRAVWLLWSGATPAERTTREYFARFPETDFFPFELRQTAAYLREHTRSDDRVQVYGMDPYVLFLAAAPQRDAVHLRVRPRRRRGARGRHGRRPRRRAGRAHPRHPRRPRGRPARPARGPAAGGVRLPRRLAAHLGADAWDDFAGALHPRGPVGARALPRERPLRPRSRLAAERPRARRSPRRR